MDWNQLELLTKTSEALYTILNNSVLANVFLFDVLHSRKEDKFVGVLYQRLLKYYTLMTTPKHHISSELYSLMEEYQNTEEYPELLNLFQKISELYFNKPSL